VGRSRKGTSLVEAAVAVGLMGVILLWSITAYTNISRQSKGSEEIEVASTLASNQIEYVKALGYSGLQSVANSISVVQFSSPYEKYGYKYVNVAVQQNSTAYQKVLSVQVYRMADQIAPLIQIDCSFLKNSGDGKNAGL
jgi:hypothetical protein